MLEDAIPNPADFIRAISEQGYRMEHAIADLVDNSISATAHRIEILFGTHSGYQAVFIADDGLGMNSDELKAAMFMPSSTLYGDRRRADLGRFGLGLKTASFSQTRKFSVLSRKKGQDSYSARTWDINILEQGSWKILVNTQDEIASALESFKEASSRFLNEKKEFQPQTIIIWYGLFRYNDEKLGTRLEETLNIEFQRLRSHLALVFHKFLEGHKRSIKIRLNNTMIRGFDPFPTELGTRSINPIYNNSFGRDPVLIQGFILPVRCLEEASNGSNPWVQDGFTLLDMEGIYLYRCDRIIHHGNWLGMYPRSHRHQLARMRIDFGNSVDHLLHLNVAKTQIQMPYDLRSGIKDYISRLVAESEKEFLNRTIRKFKSKNHGNEKAQLITSESTSKGTKLLINRNFPIISSLIMNMNPIDRSKLNFLLRIISTEMNKIRNVHEDEPFAEVVEKSEVNRGELISLILELRAAGLSSLDIEASVIAGLGFRRDTLPRDVLEAMK